MNRKPSVAIIFLTVFIDLIGFGIVLPLLPVFAKELDASGLVIGCLMAVYSAMQFLFAPVWGRWSDKVGRRPILLISTAGAAVSYALFAYACGQSGMTALVLLFVARTFAGLCGANITVAQAYIADITPPEERSKKMGLIGMAFGLGFIFGPAIGGLALKFLGMTAPGWIAAGFCTFNFIFAFARLPESWKPGTQSAARPRFEHFMETMRRPGIAVLIWVFFLATFCFAAFETTLGLLVSQNFGLKFENTKGVYTFDAKVAYLYAYCGFIGAFVQGGPLGRIVKKFGEPLLITLSLFLVAVSLAPIPFIKTWPLLLFVLAVLAIGSSLTRPPVFGMISNLTPAAEQGATIGVAQSMGSLARIGGPIFAASLLDLHPALPYLICGGISLVAAFFAWQFLHRRVIARNILTQK
ncbi:MAG TPA: MFS transporter [Dongiaceae bacterium]|nr:MFS transporter [Dongiaceae bacterium]